MSTDGNQQPVSTIPSPAEVPPQYAAMLASLNAAAVSQSPTRQALAWALGQDSTVVVLLLMFAAIGYGVYMSATVWIPAHLAAIHSGYASESQKNREENEKRAVQFATTCRDIAEKHDANVSSVMQAFDKNLDRFERNYQEGFKAGSVKH